MSFDEQSSVDEPVAPGGTLRKAREQAGFPLELVAPRTLIPLFRLRALENDDYERVGAAAFTIGYVRAYAKFLGIDPAPLLSALESSLSLFEFAPVQAAPSGALALHAQKRPRSFFWPAVIVIVVIFGVVAFIGINTVLVTDSEPAPVLPIDPANSANPMSSQPPRVTTEVPVPPANEVEKDTFAEESLADTDFGLTPPPLTTQTAAPAGLASMAGESSTTEAQESSLALSFAADCWVEVTDASGKALIARLATSGDNLQLFGRAPFEVVLGNAAAASGAFNGQAVGVAPPLGRKSMRLTVGE